MILRADGRLGRKTDSLVSRQKFSAGKSQVGKGFLRPGVQDRPAVTMPDQAIGHRVLEET
jgi:hypothetical protein